MSMPIILAIDEGTTNAKAIAVDTAGQILAKSSVPLQLDHPKPGWAEQDPLAIWYAVAQAIEGCLSQLAGARIAGVAISNQRESVLIWERETGVPLTQVVSWQCRRSEAFCQALSQLPEAAIIAERTGLQIDPLFPAAKIHGLLADIPRGVERAAHGELCVGTIDCWLTWQLTGDKVSLPTFPTRRVLNCLISIWGNGTLICWRYLVFQVFACQQCCPRRRFTDTPEIPVFSVYLRVSRLWRKLAIHMQRCMGKAVTVPVKSRPLMAPVLP